jgi:hypothetical protein
MPFDAARFEAAQLQPRRTRVRVEALAAYFPDGEQPEWEVRGLSASELQRAMDAERRQGSVESIVRAIAASGNQAQAVRKALGMTDDIPGEMAKRLEMLVMASTAPTIEMPLAVKLGECFPIEFLRLTNTITELTGMGAVAADLGKPEAVSQPTPA